MDIYQQYALLKSKIDSLERELEPLKDQIMKDMIEKGQKKAEMEYGSFSISKRKTWSYPDYIIEAEADLKGMKAKAEETEEATASETESLRFTLAKI